MDKSVIDTIRASEQAIRDACNGIDMDSAFLEKAIASDKIYNEIASLKEIGISLWVYSKDDLLVFQYEYGEHSYKFTLDKF